MKNHLTTFMLEKAKVIQSIEDEILKLIKEKQEVLKHRAWDASTKRHIASYNNQIELLQDRIESLRLQIKGEFNGDWL